METSRDCYEKIAQKETALTYIATQLSGKPSDIKKEAQSRVKANKNKGFENVMWESLHYQADGKYLRRKK